MRDALAGEEVPLALYCLYELHYRGFAGVSDDWEWDATCLELRRRLERASLRELRYEVFLSYGIEKMHAADVLMELSTLTNDTARLRSALMTTDATDAQTQELTLLRSFLPTDSSAVPTGSVAHQRNQATAGERHTTSRPLIHPSWAPAGAELFGAVSEEHLLGSGKVENLELVPSATLSNLNVARMFILHRRWRAALAGHVTQQILHAEAHTGDLASYESEGGVTDRHRWAKVHVDAVAHVAVLDQLIGGVLADEPALSDDVVFGARAYAYLETTFVTRVLSAWVNGRSSLRLIDEGVRMVRPR